MKLTRCSSSLFSPASRPSLTLQRPSRERPAERLREHLIKVLDKANQLVTQVGHRSERTTADHLPHDHTEHHLDLIQPRTVLRQIHEPDAVAQLRQEGP